MPSTGELCSNADMPTVKDAMVSSKKTVANTGLHLSDVERLLLQLNRLVEAGNTVILVEHNMEIIAASDWVIDIGPGAGEAGGLIVAEGVPADIVKNKERRTATYLAKKYNSK